jgi:hypothetical protein
VVHPTIAKFTHHRSEFIIEKKISLTAFFSAMGNNNIACFGALLEFSSNGFFLLFPRQVSILLKTWRRAVGVVIVIT